MVKAAGYKYGLILEVVQSLINLHYRYSDETAETPPTHLP
jgi:hypothetical protein